jgi:hypothetical protein
MKFPQREWVTEIATATITAAAAAVAASLFSEVPINAMLLAGIALGGFARGLLNIPLRWLLEKRPKPPDADSEDGGQ